jgi:hypothetical protein
VNVFHYHRINFPHAADKLALKNIFRTSVVVDLALALNHRWSGVQITVRWLNDATDPPQAFTIVDVGAIAGDSMPAMNSVFILFKTLLKGRKYRGGKHFGPLSETDSTTGTDDILNAAAIVRWDLVRQDCLAQIIDANAVAWQPCVVSRQPPSQLVLNPTTIVANDVSTALLNKRIGRLRRREPKSVY